MIEDDTWAELAGPLVAGLGPNTAAALRPYMEVVSLAAGEELVRQGREADCLHLLAEGELEALLEGAGGRIPVALIKAGAWVGEVHLVDPGPASATVLATRPTRLLGLSDAHFRDLVERTRSWRAGS